MRLALIIAMISGIQFYTFAQIDSTKVAIVSYWALGDSYNFKITKSTQQWRENNLVKDDTSQFIVNFEVIDSTKDSYKIKWSFKTDLVSTYKISPELMSKLSDYIVTEVIYTTTETGAFVGIENWEDIGTMMRKLISEIIAFKSPELKGKNEELERVMQPFVSSYSSKEGVEMLVFKEIQYFHSPLGAEYSITEPIEYEEVMPPIIGSKPIRCDSKMFFEYVDFELEYCVLIDQKRLNPDDTKRFLQELFTQMEIKDAELDIAIEQATYDIVDHNRYEYFYYPGIPYKIETSRDMKFSAFDENVRRVEKIIIELID
jgi:polyhydroxyalkanoate synthesis regulator phasin